MNNLFSLKNKNIIVTGSSGLLGKEYVDAIISYKGNPILIDIDQPSLETQKKRIKNLFKIDVLSLKVDITDEIQVKKSLKKILRKYKKIHGLINNAALNPKVENKNKIEFSRLENFSIKNWQKDIDVGLKGSFLCAKYFGSIIAKNPKGGSIINISSDLGLIAPDQRLYQKKNYKDVNQPVKPISYSVIKFGIIGLTKYLSTYWPEKNVRCNAICPGGVENNQPKEFINRVSSLIPLKRMAKKDEFNSTIIFLLSDSSKYINGAVISVDGGRTSW